MKLPLALILAASPALADTITIPVACAPYDSLIGQLRTAYGEHLVWEGATTDEDYIAEVHVRPDGTWSILLIDSGKRACILLAGPIWAGFAIRQGQEG